MAQVSISTSRSKTGRSRQFPRAETSWLSNAARTRSITRLAALGTFLLFLAGPFRGGWMKVETDFPNYYTAAVLVREHQPLHKYYDWTWFAREMNFAGNGTQLGAYTPQTPLTMLPMVALAGFPPQTAKRA